MTPEDLEAYGKLAYGTRWGAAVAADLKAIKGTTVSVAQLHHWRTEVRPIPAWVAPALIEAIARHQAGLVTRHRQLGALAGRLAVDLMPTSAVQIEAPVPVEAPEPDEDAPSPSPGM